MILYILHLCNKNKKHFSAELKNIQLSILSKSLAVYNENLNPIYNLGHNILELLEQWFSTDPINQK